VHPGCRGRLSLDQGAAYRPALRRAIVHGIPAASRPPSASHAMALAPPLTRPASRATRQLEGHAGTARAWVNLLASCCAVRHDRMLVRATRCGPSRINLRQKVSNRRFHLTLAHSAAVGPRCAEPIALVGSGQPSEIVLTRASGFAITSKSSPLPPRGGGLSCVQFATPQSRRSRSCDRISARSVRRQSTPHDAGRRAVRAVRAVTTVTTGRLRLREPRHKARLCRFPKLTVIGSATLRP